jgi:hypothetical protein
MDPNDDPRLRLSTSSPRQGDKAFLKQAIEELVHAGFAFYEDEAEFVPILRLTSGEVFLLGADWMARIK